MVGAIFEKKQLSKQFFGIGNQIGSEGMKYLSESLKYNNSIQTLVLWGNITK